VIPVNITLCTLYDYRAVCLLKDTIILGDTVNVTRQHYICIS